MRTIEVSIKMIATYEELDMTPHDLKKIEMSIESHMCNEFAEFESIDVTVEDY